MTIRMRHTKSHTRNRRSHHALDETVLGKCKKCGQDVLSHRACMNCGTYKGREVLDVLAKLDKKDKKKKEKDLQVQEQEEQKNKPLDATELSK